MLNYDDPKWDSLPGGYKVPFNPVPALRKLEAGTDMEAAWEDLWNGLHHQGDVGEASYAAIPHLIRMQKEGRRLDWNLFAIASVIEIERHRETNPAIPDWLEPDYVNAWRDLTTLAIGDLPAADDGPTVQYLLACIALGKGCRTLGSILLNFTEDEMKEILDTYGGG
jgi:hypothetical protein